MLVISLAALLCTICNWNICVVLIVLGGTGGYSRIDLMNAKNIFILLECESSLNLSSCGSFDFVICILCWMCLVNLFCVMVTPNAFSSG